ncbi:hypothetical protein KJY73_16275 [Bowmanella sp. Y26]|uniref:hypothetical protein n=1 Tax=Bowmanella yangjiangensis TaxID=2811230 RepID=UPI001BDD5ABB|nr:hypothetical protein [Bowmanella yangjiangensis]MBT1065150.1 hypothetical protein [Bowmanella yangjiangensis]
MRYWLSYCGLFLLSACGGGGSESANGNNSLPPSNSANTSIQGPQSAEVGQSVALLLSAEGALKNLRWKQISGPTVSMTAPKSQVLAFDVPDAGHYEFEVSFENAQGQRTLNWQFSASSGNEIKANVRLDHLAAEGAKVSLHADSGERIASVNWQLLSGPSVKTEQSEGTGQYLFYTAPQVNQDSLMHWRANIRLTDGSTYSDDAWVLVKNANPNTDGFFPRYAQNVVSPEAHPYLADSPHAANLVACAYNNQIASSCPFSRLPLLGSEHENPDIQQVLARLIVTHDWMGDNFKRYLEESDPALTADMLKLLRATTAVVIGYDVRPSFYWTATGAIYLDAANLWLTPAQRDSLNDQPDYRSDFGNDLRFFMPWRYVKDNQSYLSRYEKSPRQNRDFADMQASLTWLLYHELAHANDFFPYHSWSGLAANDSPLAHSNQQDPTSRQFTQRYPLQSSEMKNLAKVSFAGDTANATQRAYLPEDVVSFFAPDLAVGYYSYSTEREDFANAFEMFMMSYRLGVEADTAVVGSVDNPQAQITWGQRSRHNLTNIQPRVNYAVQNILPHLNIPEARETMPTPLLLPPGVAWKDTLDPVAGAQDKPASNARESQVRKPVDRPTPFSW